MIQKENYGINKRHRRDIVFDAAGGGPGTGLSGDQTLLASLEPVRDEGKVVQIANIERPVTLDIRPPQEERLAVLARRCSEGLMQHVVDLVATRDCS